MTKVEIIECKDGINSPSKMICVRSTKPLEVLDNKGNWHKVRTGGIGYLDEILDFSPVTEAK